MWPPMFIVPLSLYVMATYLRPRTQTELSYLITAIECLSGLWCLLFGPVQLQLLLIGFCLTRNTKTVSSLLNIAHRSRSSVRDLSDLSTQTIDVEAHPVPQAQLEPTQLHSESRLTPLTHSPASPKHSDCSVSLAIQTFQDEDTFSPQVNIAEFHSAPDNASLDAPLVASLNIITSVSSPVESLITSPRRQAKPSIRVHGPKQKTSHLTQLPKPIQLQYRGTLYIKVRPAPNRSTASTVTGQYRGVKTQFLA